MKKIFFLFLLLPHMLPGQTKYVFGVIKSGGTPGPTITRSPSSLTGFSTTEGTASAYQTATISGSTLSGDIAVSGTTHWETSVSSGSGYTGSTTLSESGGSVSGTIVYFRIKATATAGTYTETCNITSPGATTQHITLTGTVDAAGGGGAVAKFSFSKTAKTCSGWTNIFGEPNVSVLTGTDAGTGITFTSVATANWSPNVSSGFDGNGTQSGSFFNDCAGTATAVMYNGWVNTAQYNHTKPQVQLGGLNTGKTYTIALTGSTTGGTLRTTDVYVEGSTLSSVQTFNAKSNTSNGATFTGVAPDGSGTIRIFVCAHSTSPEQGHMDAFTITEE